MSSLQKDYDMRCPYWSLSRVRSWKWTWVISFCFLVPYLRFAIWSSRPGAVVQQSLNKRRFFLTQTLPPFVQSRKLQLSSFFSSCCIQLSLRPSLLERLKTAHFQLKRLANFLQLHDRWCIKDMASFPAVFCVVINHNQ